MRLRILNFLNGKVLSAFASVAVAGLLMASLPAHAQPPSPNTVETNVKGVYAYTQPPPSFNPMTASAAELQQYGYPPRPAADASPNDLAQWKMVVNPALTRVVPQLSRRNIRHAPIAGPQIKNGTLFSYNWSGRALVHPRPAFSTVSGSWMIPTAQQPFGACTGGWIYSSQWVGIDGFTANSNSIFQAGSDADAYCNVGSTMTDYYPWIEWFPGFEYELLQNNNDPWPMVQGDVVIVTVTATDWTNGESSNGTLLFTDLTQNWQASLTVTAGNLGGLPVVGHSAEWIVERPEVNGTLADLTNYIGVPWFAASAMDVNGRSYAPGVPHGARSYKIIMVDNVNKPISKVDLINGTNRALFGPEVLWFFDTGSAFSGF